MKDGKKIEVFMNEKGQYYRKDANGKTILLNDTELAAIQTEKITVQVMQNFIVDKNGKRQEVLTDDKGNPFYINENGDKVFVPK